MATTIKKHKQSINTDDLHRAIINVVCHQRYNNKKDINIIYIAILSWVNASRKIPYVAYLMNYGSIEVFDVEKAFSYNPPQLMELVQCLFMGMLRTTDKCTGLGFNLDQSLDKPQVIKYVKQFITFEILHWSTYFKCGVSSSLSCNASIVTPSGTNCKRKLKYKKMYEALAAKSSFDGSAEDPYCLFPESIYYLNSLGYTSEEIAQYRIAKVGVENANIFISEDIEASMASEENPEPTLADRLFSSVRSEDILYRANLTTLELHLISAYFEMNIPIYSRQATKYVKLDMKMFFHLYPEYATTFKVDRVMYVGGRKCVSRVMKLDLIVHTELYKTAMSKLRKAAEMMLID